MVLFVNFCQEENRPLKSDSGVYSATKIELMPRTAQGYSIAVVNGLDPVVEGSKKDHSYFFIHRNC